MRTSLCINILLQNSANTTVANIIDLREYIRTAIPSAKVTWCPDNNFVFTGNKNAENVQVATYLLSGDSLAMGDGFPAIDHPTLAGFQASVDEFYTNSTARYGITPTVYTSWHCPATYLSYLYTKGVRTATATVWSQTGVDRFQGEGSRLFPYYPSSTNSFVPAKTESEKIDIVSCNSLSPDPLGCRVLSGDSRWTLHPADPVNNSTVTSTHILSEAIQSGSVPLFVYPEIEWLYANPSTLLATFKGFIDYCATRASEFDIISLNDYGTAFRLEHSTNDFKKGMTFTGSGFSFGNSSSDSNLKQYWYEDRDCSVCIQENLTTHIKTVECCLNYISSQPESLGYFSYLGTLYKDYSYRIGKSYKFDQFGTYHSKEIKYLVERAKDYHRI